MEYITNDILQKAENIANMANNLTIDDLLNLGIYNQYKFIYSGQPFNLQTNSKLGILNFLQSKAPLLSNKADELFLSSTTHSICSFPLTVLLSCSYKPNNT